MSSTGHQGLLLATADAPNLVGLPQPCSVRHLVSQYLDIASVPRRSFFELLACLSPHELEREKLMELASGPGQEERHEYCTRPRRTVLEVRPGGCLFTQGPRPCPCSPSPATPNAHPRCCVTSRTLRPLSLRTTCWTSFLQSGPGPSPSPPPCW